MDAEFTDDGDGERSLVAVYLNRRMAVLGALGFSSGLPYMLTGVILQAWMTEANVSLAKIGLFSLVTLPYTLKFLWSPLMDWYVPPMLGRRRGWLVITQVLLMGALAFMAISGASANLYLLAAAAWLVAFFSASQDIVADAYRTDVLSESQRGAGAAVFVTGYRLALIVSSSGALLVAGHWHIPWPAIYLGMAWMMLAGIVATITADEPGHDAARPELSSAIIDPVADFVGRRGWWLVILFIVLFKLPDVLAEGMKMPFLMKMGYTKEQIGAIGQGLGLAMSIVGALCGGGTIARMGLWRSLWLFGILQAVSNVGFWVLAHMHPNVVALTGVICVENYCAGLVTAGFLAFLMSQCDRRFSATQFALLSSLMAVTRVLSMTPSGYLAEALGWSGFFLLSIAAGVPGMALLLWLRPTAQPLPEAKLLTATD